MKKLWDTITNAYVAAMGGNVKEHYLSPLTYSYSPGCNDPQGDAEDQKHCARADSHQSLHHKPCVKVHLMRNHRQTHKLIGSFDTAYFFSPRKFVCIHLHYSAMFTEVQLTTTPLCSSSITRARETQTDLDSPPLHNFLHVYQGLSEYTSTQVC